MVVDGLGMDVDAQLEAHASGPYSRLAFDNRFARGGPCPGKALVNAPNDPLPYFERVDHLLTDQAVINQPRGLRSTNVPIVLSCLRISTKESVKAVV